MDSLFLTKVISANFSSSDSAQADQLESEKKSARTKAADSRRKKFQAQDSVLNETFNASQVWDYICIAVNEIVFRKSATNDDNSMLQMTALVSVVSFMILVLFPKGDSSQPPGYLVPGSPAGQTQFNAILCCILFSYYLISYFLG